MGCVRCTMGAGAAPVHIVASIADESIKGRVWPGMGTSGVCVLDRIVMNVVAQAFEFGFVADGMFPETALPDAAFILFLSRIATGGFGSTSGEVVHGERRFDQTPAGGIVFVAVGKSPNAVQVIGQQDNGIHVERMVRANRLHGGAKGRACRFRGQDRAAEVGYQCEEVGTAGKKEAAVFRHGTSQPKNG